ncbi:MAG: NAD(P)H-dependent oxidoreductase [Candidatus Cloacimonetes bacterium]|nr:NAD(P)H-dependent oxidoreductase [Candidatus Cloacimonadota bacterium]
MIKSHPPAESFRHALAGEYIGGGGIEAGHVVGVIKLSDLDLVPYLKAGHRDKIELTPELISIQDRIKATGLLVFAYPTSWAIPLALPKLFLGSILLSGFACQDHKSEGIVMTWDKLLKGCTARLTVSRTMPAASVSMLFILAVCISVFRVRIGSLLMLLSRALNRQRVSVSQSVCRRKLA